MSIVSTHGVNEPTVLEEREDAIANDDLLMTNWSQKPIPSVGEGDWFGY